MSSMGAMSGGLSATGGIGRRTVLGMAWAILAFGAVRALSIGTNLVLARLLTPADFGLVGFALVFIGACRLLQDLGVSAAIVYSGRDPREVAGTALTINVLAAVGLFALLVLASPIVATMQEDPATATVLIALSVGLVIGALGSVQNAVLMKDLDYRRKLVPDAVPYAIGGVISIGMAVTGYGVWSLVVGTLARTAVSTVLLWWLSDIRPLPSFRWPVAVDLLTYGRHAAFSSFIGFASNNLDYLVIGYFLGAHELGVYTLAYVIANLIPTISQTAVSVIFPAISRVREDEAAHHALFAHTHRALWTLTLPLAVLLFIGAPPVVHVVLGRRWAESVVPLQILAVAAWLQSAAHIYSPVLKAVGRPDVLWKLLLARTALGIPVLTLAAQFGVEGVAVGVVFGLAAFTPVAAVVACRSMGYTPRQLLMMLLPPLISAAAMCGVVVAAYALPDLRTMSERLPGAILLGIAALAVYVCVLARLDPSLLAAVLRPRAAWRHASVQGIKA
jgi:PST family polysaccharide transporter